MSEPERDERRVLLSWPELVELIREAVREALAEERRHRELLAWSGNEDGAGPPVLH